LVVEGRRREWRVEVRAVREGCRIMWTGER